MKLTGKPRLLIGLWSDIFFRNFVEPGAFEQLAQRYDMFWMTTDAVKRSLPEYPGFTVAGRSKTSRWRDEVRYHLRWISVFAGHRHSRTMALKRKAMSFRSHPELWLYWLLGQPGVWPVVHSMAEGLMGLNRSMVKIVDRVHPDTIVFPSQGNDSFAIDIMKVAKSREIPTVMLNYNWDNMGSKGCMRIKPTRLCVWGEDMAELAARVHSLAPQQIKIIGAAHFEQYFDSARISQARATAGTSGNSLPTILFAGASRGHAEARYLQFLEQAIENKHLPQLKVIYRPHPWRSPRSGEKDFHDYGFKHIVMDPQLADHFSKGMNAPERNPDRTFAPSIDYNMRLLYAVDGLITPLSTMALEAALVGVPVLAIFFPEEDWLKGALENFEHLQRVRRDLQGLIICDREDQLVAGVAKLLTLRQEPSLPRRMREAVRPIVYSDPASSYSERLVQVIDELLGYTRASPSESWPQAFSPSLNPSVAALGSKASSARREEEAY